MYNGTKKWGTVRITMKRLFAEAEGHKNKDSKSKERLEHRRELCKDKKAEFDTIVKAKTSKRNLSVVVSAKESVNFQKKLAEMMSANMFKELAKTHAILKKENKKASKKGPREEEKKGKGAGVAVKKNRQERRKELAKKLKKEHRKLLKEKRAKETVAN
jgi:hypothetical protein